MVLITADQSPAPASSALCSKGSIADGYLSSAAIPPKYYVDDKVAMQVWWHSLLELACPHGILEGLVISKNRFMTAFLNAIEDFVRQIRLECQSNAPDYVQLQAFGKCMREICLASNFDLSQFRRAGPGEEFMYPLSEDPAGGPSVYLVSDGVGVNTPPHDHRTWAVIVGLAGTEFHVFYDCADANSLTETKACAVAKGDVLVMTESDIHAIDATRGMHPTWHVHLYGRSQASLPSFASRCYPTTD